MESPEALVSFAKAWMRDSGGRSLDEFLEALVAPQPEGTHRPAKYGFRAECTGPGTLRNHLVISGVDLGWLREATEGP